jgi:hypothetical protein
VSTTALAAAVESGLPPYVEMLPTCQESATGTVASVAPRGSPFAMPFAIVMMSGSTFECWMPHMCLPVRPKPVCTSSAMKRPPYLRTMATAVSK